MKSRTLKKLWKGKIASLRDYEVEGFISKGGVVLKYKKQKMTLSVEKLQAMFQCHKQLIKSQFNDKTYQLVDCVFKPDEEPAEINPDLCYCNPISPRPLTWSQSVSPDFLQAKCHKCKKIHTRRMTCPSTKPK